jgi:hypothetical protein
MSLVAADGGNNQLQFDPFLIELVRVVDSSNNEYCLEAISPTMPIKLLNSRQFDSGPKPTALGHLMMFLGVDSLPALSNMIRQTEQGQPVSPSWVKIYRELVEWAVLFSILKKDFATDTLIIFDGLLRSKVFAGDLFNRLLAGMKNLINGHWENSRRRIYLAGVAKHSKVLSRYRLAMALEGILKTKYPSYAAVPKEVEEKAYIWSEFAWGDDSQEMGKEINRFVGGKMYLVKFGSRPSDPVWPVDIFTSQADDAQIILGSMLADAINGFPIPHYPRCLQKAHENAALVDFEFDIFQDYIYQGIRANLGEEAGVLDAIELQNSAPAQNRYR